MKSCKLETVAPVQGKWVSRISGGSASTQTLSVSQEKVVQLLEKAAQDVMNDLETAITKAYAKDDVARATELRDAWFNMFKVRAHIDYSPYVGADIAKTDLYLPKGDLTKIARAEMTYHADKVMDLYLHGSPAAKALGYTLDYPAGEKGLRMLIAHELRHTFISNHFDKTGKPYSDRAVERDADAFVGRMY